MSTVSSFRASLEAHLANSNYTRWALDRGFSDDNLLALLCMLGEFDRCASRMLNPLFDDWKSLRPYHRPIFALEGLYQITRGERFDCEDWPRRLLTGRIALQTEDLPETVSAAISGGPASMSAVKQIQKIDEGFEIGGLDEKGGPIWAYIALDGKLIHRGPDRRRGETTKASAFSPALIDRIGIESRARWAIQRVCAEEHLRCILWLVGEFVSRTNGAFEAWKRDLPHDRELANGVVALEAMRCMVRFRERLDVTELDRRIERGRGHLEYCDLPEDVREKLMTRFPGRQWNYIWMIHDEYTALGESAKEMTIEVQIMSSGELTVQ